MVWCGVVCVYACVCACARAHVCVCVCVSQGLFLLPLIPCGKLVGLRCEQELEEQRRRNRPKVRNMRELRAALRGKEPEIALMQVCALSHSLPRKKTIENPLLRAGLPFSAQERAGRRP